MTQRVWVTGQGELAHLVERRLDAADFCTLTRNPEWTGEVPSGIDLGIVLDDGWQPAVTETAEASFRSAGVPWVRGFVALGYGIIGPFVRPGHAGCSQCADTRLLMAESDRQEMWRLREWLATNHTPEPDEQPARRRDAWVSRTGLVHMTTLIMAQVEQALRCPDACRLANHILRANLMTLETTWHFVLPITACPVCGTPATDTPEAATITLEPTPKVSATSFRSRSIGDFARKLSQDYLDPDTGLLNAKVQDLVTPFATVSVNLPLPMGDEGTAGRANVYSDCEPVAILEGLERYCGIEPRGKRPVVRAAFEQIANHALHPASVGLHDPLQYDRPDFPFRAFREDAQMDWVWAHSLTEQRPILVPLHLAYYSLGFHEDAFVYETSNGCAVGSTMSEAIFHGILEVVERDAFLLTWYAQLALPLLDLSTHPDRELRWMMERLRTVTGYGLHFYNATMENAVPTVFVVAKNRRSRGLNLLCSAASHLDPLRAVKAAIHETAGMLLRFDDKMEAERDRYLHMLKYPSRLREMADHSMLYGLPEAEARLGFLLDDNRPVQTLAQAFPRQFDQSADLTEDLQALLQVFKRLKLNVMVVDQTSPELSRNGLSCVKVIVPGMLPMTFGYQFTRLEHLDRVLNVPMQLGYRDRPLTKKELNPHPHPFP
ncbi:TOMM precursor leader peptide-binding protein [Alicyclobacillus sp. ALC3]|uniref:TOMM precursor leader peptide-binding protein n=1 Tax=Alicyclobacillus sp. ALC3 TaxID=2796143 RepID=UPI002378915A|nr:TOMM precursor leader peptide-binding protein [Alicyclobacillus sp. ALC3]WDL98348.1 TOMM precursor leader peptide-binding protein [Alicyclobacillus sp. ALC3]